MIKAGGQFENHSLVKFPTHIPKLNKEERERMMKVLVHCKAEDRLVVECISSFPKQGPTTEEVGPLQTNVTQVDAGPLQTKDVTQVLPSELDDQLFQDIGCIFRGDQEGVEAIISRHERRRLKRLIRMYLDVVLSATLLVLPAATTTTTTTTTMKELATETSTAAHECRQPEEVLEDIDMMSSVQEFVAKHFDRRKRTVQMECHNGRNTTLVARPFSKDEKSFVNEAKRSKWINEMLPNDAYIRGMCIYLFEWRQDIYKDVASAKTIGVNVFTTVPFGNTMAISSELGLRSGQLRDLRSLLKTQGVQLEMPDKEVDRLNREVGNITSNDPVCKSSVYNHPEGDKESCNYCIVPIEKEICLEVQKYLQSIGEIRNLDYDHPDQEMVGGSPGITVLFGGDHGDGKFRFHAKPHLSSPHERKERGDLSFGCPLTPMCNLECRKDTHGLLESTVMKTVSNGIEKLLKSACIVIHNSRRGTEFCKATLVPASADINNMKLGLNGKSFQYTEIMSPNEWKAISIPEELWGPDATATKVISCFHDLYVGDLAFFAVILGMPGQSSGRCLSCNITSANFNSICDRNAFSIEVIKGCLQRLKEKRAGGLKTKNVNGVTADMLLPISCLSKVLVPTLHCPMGLIDKFLESFMGWAHRDVIQLTEDEDNIRNEYVMAEEHLAIAIDLLAEVKENADDSDESTAMIRFHQDAKNHASAAKTKAYDEYKEMIKVHKRNPDSFHNDLEETCRKLNIVRECYHGGKYNGVNCIKIMNNSDKIIESASQALIELKSDDISEEEILGKSRMYSELLNTLDNIWSNVCSIHTGLLPSDDDLHKLESLLIVGKQQWLDLGISTAQPKWHLTFDGLLLRQVTKYGGLADKGDSPIEHGHQIFGRLHNRFRRAATFQQREIFIMRAYRRRSHPKCLSALKEMNSKRPRHDKHNSPRQRKRIEDFEMKQTAKRIKREVPIEED